jgi:hypothetical protein
MDLCGKCEKDPELCTEMGCSCECHGPNLSQEWVEAVAEAIYRNAACDPEEFERLMGEPMKEWKTNAPWDTNPNELTEHARDDYRRMARAAISICMGGLNQHLASLLEPGSWVTHGGSTYKVVSLRPTPAGMWVDAEGPQGSLGCYLPSVRLATKNEEDKAVREMSTQRR